MTVAQRRIATMETSGPRQLRTAAGNRSGSMRPGLRVGLGLVAASVFLAACSPPVSSEPYPADPGETRDIAADTLVYADPELTQSCGTTVGASEDVPIEKKVDFNSAPDEITTSGSVFIGDLALVTAQTPCDGKTEVWIYLGSRIVPMVRF